MVEVQLTQGHVALVDDEDAELVRSFRWHLHRSHGRLYARSRRGGYLHRLLMAPAAGLEVDHIDGDGLNCQRGNLRVVTHAQNLQNRLGGYGRSRHRGVSWHAAKGRWFVRVKVDGREHFGGYFEDEDMAGAVARLMREDLMSHATA